MSTLPAMQWPWTTWKRSFQKVHLSSRSCVLHALSLFRNKCKMSQENSLWTLLFMLSCFSSYLIDHFKNNFHFNSQQKSFCLDSVSCTYKPNFD
jgi:hypothetical protein